MTPTTTRSVFSRFFGNFFTNSSNTAGLLALGVMVAVIYLFVKTGQAPDRLLDILYVIVGFYFGGATKNTSPPEP
jgi:hypothetical protein